MLAILCSTASADVGLLLGPTVGGGSLVGLSTELQVSRRTFFDLQAGARPGFDVTSGIVYGTAALSLGVNAQWGQGRGRHGVFGSTGATIPIGTFEAWVSGGWHFRSWSERGNRAFSLQVGPGLWLARDLPEQVYLPTPYFVHIRLSWAFSVIPRDDDPLPTLAPPSRDAPEQDPLPRDPPPREPPPSDPPPRAPEPVGDAIPVPAHSVR